MDPITLLLAALAIGGSQALETLPVMLNSKEDKYNKEQLKKLESIQKNQGFGLSNNTKELMRNETINPALRSLQAQQNQSTTGVMGGSTGADIARQSIQDANRSQSLGQLTGSVGAQVRALDEAKKEQQKQELENRIAYQSARNQERLAAGLSIPSQIIQGMTGQAMMGQMLGAAPAAAAPAAAAPASTVAKVAPPAPAVPQMPTYPTSMAPPAPANNPWLSDPAMAQWIQQYYYTNGQ